MTCITPTRYARIEAKIVTKEAQLVLAQAALDAALPNAEVSEYEFDSGEGRQQVKRRNVTQLQKTVKTLEDELDSLYQQKEGTGITRRRITRYGK
jgi:hypothetical protein